MREKKLWLAFKEKFWSFWSTRWWNITACVRTTFRLLLSLSLPLGKDTNGHQHTHTHQHTETHAHTDKQAHVHKHTHTPTHAPPLYSASLGTCDTSISGSGNTTNGNTISSSGRGRWNRTSPSRSRFEFLFGCICRRFFKLLVSSFHYLTFQKKGLTAAKNKYELRSLASLLDCSD